MQESTVEQYERALYAILMEGFQGGNVATIEPSFQKKIEEVLAAAQWEAAIALFLLLSAEDPDFGRWVDMSMERQKTLSRWMRRSEASMTRQVKRLLARMKRTNKKREGSDWLGSASRAESIAITEITQALSMGEEVAAGIALKNGFILESVWVTALDEQVCPVCGPLHNMPELSWSDEFPYGPPAHVRCRCRKRWRLRKKP